MSLFSTQPIAVLSSVDGGPITRLARGFGNLGVPAVVVSQFDPQGWRSAMSSGRAGRIAARLSALTTYPLRAVIDTALGEHDVLVPTTNTFVIPALVAAFRRLHDKPVVAAAYDLYPDALEAAGAIDPDSLLSRALAALNRYWFERVDGIVFIGRRMAEHAIARYGEPKAWTVIETGAHADEFTSFLEEPLEPESDLEAWCAGKDLVASYVGNLGLMHEWETLAEAIRRWAERDDADRLGFVIVATGPGAERLREACREVSPEVVRFEPPLDDRAWARLLACSNVSFVTLREKAKRTCIPSKAFSAMAARAALVVVAPQSCDLADLVDREECGTVAEPGDADTVLDALEQWLDRPEELERVQERARQAIIERYDIDQLARRWLEFIEDCRQSKSGVRQTGYDALKRLIDLAASSAGLLATAPILASVAAAIRLTMGSPVLFRQRRPGKDGEPFELLKFRTMRHPKSGEEGPDSDADRITALGAFLRATSLDELPTLLNVLKGEMSLVGPRPLLMRYLDRYTPEQARRHDAKPGVTGWAQINGRNALSWAEKFDHDVWYVDHRSTILDLKILVATLGKVLEREGISQDDHATMPEFMGTKG